MADTKMSPRQVVQAWVARFNAADIDGLAALYAETAINHQVVTEPLHGQAAIHRLFEVEFGRAQMVCLVENLFEDGEWAILEWRDPNGLRGCGFFTCSRAGSSSSAATSISCRSSGSISCRCPSTISGAEP